MHNNTRNEINELLRRVDRAQINQGIGWTDQEQEDLPPTTEQGRPTLHIYILNHPLEEQLAEQANDSVIESDARHGEYEDSGMAPDAQSKSPPSTSAGPVRQRKCRPVIPLVLIGLALIGVLMGLAVAILLTQAPTASITLTPVQTEISVTTTVKTVLGKPDVTRHGLQARLLSSLTLSQARMVPTTGTGHQQARAARGSITFYNAQPSAQVIAAGTVIAGRDGVQVVTDQDAVIPPAAFPIDGQTTVSAHAATIGPGGNIRGGDIYGPCCRLNVFATNGAFHGGQDARTYPRVRAQDIKGTATSLESDLEKSIEAGLQTQVHPGESLITPVPCTPTVTADHIVGDEAAQVNVTVSETCMGEAYAAQGLRDRVTAIAAQQATRRLGTGYTLSGDVKTTISKSSVTDQRRGTITLEVQGAGTWVYQFSQQQLESMATTIAGKSKSQAAKILLQTSGVHTVSLTLTGRDTTTLPPDPKAIHFLIGQAD